MDSLPVRPVRAARPAWRRVPALPVAALLLAGPMRPADARPGDEAVAAGDQHYAAGRLAEARAAYAEAVKASPASVAALCKLARAGSELGETQSGDTQRMTWAEAVAHAREAVRLAPDSARPHMWLAIALGRQSLREGPRSRMALAREIKGEADRALALDAGLAGAWHVLAEWNARVAGLSGIERLTANAVLGGVPKGASFESADEAFRKAIQLEPGFVNHHLAYARMLKEQKRYHEARLELEKALSLPPTSSPLDPQRQAEARELMEKLPKEKLPKR